MKCKMNNKNGQAKLLAALAVFAMVACVFAAVPMAADEADAATAKTVTIDGVTYTFESTMDYTVVGDTIKFTGVATAGTIAGVDTSFDAMFNSGNNLVGPWSAMTFGFDITAGKNIYVVQTNSALKTAYEVDIQEDIDPTTGVKKKGYDTAGAAIGASDFMIPKSTESTVTFAIYETDDVATEIPEGEPKQIIKMDFSEVSTKVVLDSNLNGTGWTYTGDASTGTLAFTNYDGKEIFSQAGTLNVTFSGDNTINAYSAMVELNSTNYIVDQIPVLEALTKLTVASTVATDTLEINQNSGIGFGIASATIEIGGSVTENTTLLDMNGGNRSVFAGGNLTIQNATFYAEGSERSIRSNGETNVINSNVIAMIIPPVATNSVGDNDLFGIKTGTLDIDATSEVNTEGLRIEGATLTNAGTLVVYGGYEQNPEAKNMASLIA